MNKAFKSFAALVICLAVMSSCATIRQWIAGSKTSPADKLMRSSTSIGHADRQNNSRLRYSEDKTPFKAGLDLESSTQQLSKKFTDRMLDIARTKIGCRYVYASKGPMTFDCSGFTSYVYKRVGITIPSSSAQQALLGRRLEKDEALRPGDLVFFSGRKISKTVGHVGIVLDQNPKTGEFSFIHTAITSGVEIQKSTQEYYAPRYLYAVRILPDVAVFQEDCHGRDLMRTFYLIAEGLADGTGYDIVKTETTDVNRVLFDNATWAVVRSSDFPLSGYTLDALLNEYMALYPRRKNAY